MLYCFYLPSENLFCKKDEWIVLFYSGQPFVFLLFLCFSRPYITFFALLGRKTPFTHFKKHYERNNDTIIYGN